MMDYNEFIVLSQKNYDDFKRQNGERKLLKITQKINSSKHTASLLYQSRQKRVVPTSEDFGSSVMSNLSMALANRETVRFAASYLLEKWHNEVNEDLELAQDEEVVSLFNRINRTIN